MALTQEQVTLISVAAFGVTPGKEHSQYFLDSDVAGKFLVGSTDKIGSTDKQIHEVLGLKEPLTGTAAVAAVLAHEYNYLVVTKGLEEVSNAEFVKNTAKNLGAELGAENSKTLAVDLASGMPRYEALVKFAEAEAEKAGGIEKVAGIITAQKSKQTLDNAKDDLVGNGTPTEPTDPSVPGESRMLTADADELVGTSANNTFVARGVEQNANGIVTNTFGTGDKIDGVGGVNTLDATIISDYVANGGTTAIRAETENVQNVFLNARAVTTENNVLVDADNMVGVRQWWSNNSDTTLVVENVTTHANTEDVTIGMRSTGNAGRNGERTESNYEIYFKEDHLVAGQAAGVDPLGFRMMDQDAFDAGKQELAGYALDALSFQLDGTVHTLTFAEPNAADKPNTWAQMVDYLNAALEDQLGNLVADNDIEFVLGGTFRDPNGRVGREIELQVDNITDNTRLTTPENLAAPHLAINFSSSTSENIYRFSGEIDGTGTTDLPITSTIILDDVGRGSDGGYLKVGSMSEGSQGSTGVEVFNVTVQGDSSLSYMVSTNDALRVVNVSNADGLNDGDLTLGNNRTGDSNGGYGLQNIEVFNASGMRGDVELSALVSNIANHTYTLGAGNDTLNIDVSEQSSAYAQFGLLVDATAGGDNIINVDLVSTGNSNVADNWYANQSALNNITINAGSGNDVIWTQGAGDARISAGRGDDVVYTDNTGDKASWALSATDVMNDLIGQAAVNPGIGAVTDKMVIRVTYNDQAAAANAETAGFESVVDLRNYSSVNEAVKAAIKDDHVLSALLTVKDGPRNSLIIESKVDGATVNNAIAIDAGLTNGQNNLFGAFTAAQAEAFLGGSEWNSLKEALKTTPSEVVSDTGVNTALTSAVTAVDYNTNVVFNDGSDSTAVSSNIITFIGGHDAVVLGNGDGQDQILYRGSSNDKLTLVNFDAAQDRVDFSHYLNTQVFNSAPATAGSTSTGNAAAPAANANVNGVHVSTAFNAVNPAVTTDVSFAQLNAQHVVNALRGDLTGPTNLTVSLPGGAIAVGLFGADGTATNLTPRDQKIDHVILIENPANDGEYKIFKVQVEYFDNAGAPIARVSETGAQELGVIDFGRTITAPNLFTTVAAGDNDLSATEYDLEDGLVINTPNEHVQVNVPFGVQADSIGVAIRALDVTFNFAVNQITTLSTGSTVVVGGDLTVNGGTLDITAGTLVVANASGGSGIILNSGLIITAEQAQALITAGVTFTSESATPSKIVIKAADGTVTEVGLTKGEKVELTAPEDEDEDETWGKSEPIVDEAPSEEPTEEPTDPELPADSVAAVVDADGIANVEFEGTDAADVFTVTLDEATAAGLDLGQITITDFGANDQLVLNEVYEGGFGPQVDLGGVYLDNPVIAESNSEGNLELTLMKAIDVENADIDVWTITFENADETIIEKALAGDFTDWLLF